MITSRGFYKLSNGAIGRCTGKGKTVTDFIRGCDMFQGFFKTANGGLIYMLGPKENSSGSAGAVVLPYKAFERYPDRVWSPSGEAWLDGKRDSRWDIARSVVDHEIFALLCDAPMLAEQFERNK